MHKPHIVADSKIPYLRGLLEPFATIDYLAPADITPAAVRYARVLAIRTRTTVNEQLLRDSQCRFVATATIGYDHIDTAYCAAHGIEWVNAPGCNASSVGQYVLASVLAWAHARHLSPCDLTIGIVGVGHVGRIVEQYCRMVGMQVLLNDPPRARCEGSAAFVTLGEIAARAQVVTFHTPLTRDGDDATYHLANEQFFARCACKPLIINSSRGSVVDNVALLQALRTGQVTDVVMDCWEGEPHIDASLLSDAFIATPHIAGYSADGKSNATRMTVSAIARHLGIAIDTTTIVPPAPPAPLLSLAGSDNPLLTAVLATYDPLAETRALRSAPSHFEAMRNAYPLRREFSAYTLTDVPAAVAPILSALGFTVE